MNPFNLCYGSLVRNSLFDWCDDFEFGFGFALSVLVPRVFFCARKFWVGSDLQEFTRENEIALTVFQQRRLLRHFFT
jgi:hypothetical protein